MRKILLLLGLSVLLTFSIACRKKNGCTDTCAKNYSNAKNDDGSCEYVKPVIDYINHFSDNCKPPYGVNFYTRVSNISCDVKYVWNFGDGTASLERNPYHIYASSGNYTVSVRAINQTEETTFQINITLDTTKSVVSYFTYSAQNDNYRLPAKINFLNGSDFSGDFMWDFGDGATSSQKDPSHIYTASGNFTVTLRSNCGSKKAIYTKTIEILPKPTIISLIRYRIYAGEQALSSEKGTPLYMQFLYNNSSKMFSKLYLFKSYPVSWYFPDDIDNGVYKINDPAFLNADFLTFRIWLDEIGPVDKQLNQVSVDYNYLKSNYFPATVYWDFGGYRVEASLFYQ